MPRHTHLVRRFSFFCSILECGLSILIPACDCDLPFIDDKFDPYPLYMAPMILAGLGMFLQWVYILKVGLYNNKHVRSITEVDAAIGLWQVARFLIWIVVIAHFAQLSNSTRNLAMRCFAWNCIRTMMTGLSILMLVLLVILTRSLHRTK
jgi:hypothetical protein